MLQTALAAFVLGTIGSFHCIGMCGPLALSLPLKNDTLFSKFTGALLYNSGRIVTYSLLGAAAGSIGMGFSIFGLQQWLSIIAGMLLLLFLILSKLFPAIPGNKTIAGSFFEKLRQTFGQLFFKKNYRSLFAIGFLNGLLPCGFVYVAMAGAISTGSVVKSAVFMAAFGAGTLPVMWSIAFWGNVININLRNRIRKMYPYMMMLVACLLILRGLGLSIPYISPAQEAVTNKINCFAKP